ncbi:MAG: DUF1285 domain-containing protein [Hahellaceae bacterium]|nr:DUF1285 domain-containing protein [Hahellaceae bacterium]MCP5170421.1 DUF1285 domain-containing protein [Hahellaceae bacterium]
MQREIPDSQKVNELISQLKIESPTVGLPPIENWHPDFTGDIDIQIRNTGEWFFQGDLMSRESLVKLFAGILRREDDGNYYLVTPVEKVRISVDDAPLQIVDYHWRTLSDGLKVLELLSNLGDVVVLAADNTFRFSGGDGITPYVHVRRGLLARVSRGVFYRLVEGAIADAEAENRVVDGEMDLYIESMGVRHALAREPS